MKLHTFLGLSLAVAACGGGTSYDVRAANTANGADAKIVANVKEEQHNTMLQMEAKNLPPPERVDDAATTYVAWYRKNEGSQWSKLGTLEYTKGDRQGKLQASAPETKFEIIVSAEKAPDIVSPSPKVVFQQQIGH